MNFFERQAEARRASRRLILLFGLAVLAIVAVVDFAVLVGLGFGSLQEGRLISPVGPLVVTTLLTLAVIGLSSLYRIASLRSGGGESVAAGLGGQLVPEDTTDLSLRRLRNVVEEMAIASGVPMPRLYVLEQDAGINAFAAGYSPSDAVVAVTRGALDRLNRDELQGVIAHEFSHVLNGDMRLNIRLIGMLFGIMVIALIGRKVLEHGRFGGREKGAGVIMVAAIAALLIGYVGLFFARMIKAGISRSRETLADASAVQFTRQTAGLAGALKKIAGVEGGSKLAHASDAEEVSHMLFGDGVGFSGLFATHPPLLKRIQALEPNFSDAALKTLRAQWQRQVPSGMEEDRLMGLVAGGAGTAMPPPLPRQATRIEPRAVVAQVAQPADDDYQRADAILSSMPEALRDLAGQRVQVMPLLLGLLIDRADGALAQRQAEMITTRLGEELAQSALAIQAQLLDELHPALRLPLACLAFPVLRQFPRPDLDRFLAAVNDVVHADAEVSLFEYCLGTLLRVQVREALDPGRLTRAPRRPLQSVRDQIVVMLALVAQAGAQDPAAARTSFLQALERVLPGDAATYAPPAAGAQALDQAWPALDALDPLAKEVVIEAITTAITCDGQTTVAEAELLRTICGVLHCPLPPQLSR